MHTSALDRPSWRSANYAKASTNPSPHALPPYATVGLDIKEIAQVRYSAIAPILAAPRKERRATLLQQAGTLGIGRSTLYRWLCQYDPKVGIESLVAERRRVPSAIAAYADSANDDSYLTYWMVPTTADNWIADKTENFCWTGIDTQYVEAAERMTAGDLIVTYVSGRGFSDIRRVVRRGTEVFAGQVPYTDGPIGFVIETRPVNVLHFDQHIKKPVAHQKLGVSSLSPRVTRAGSVHRLRGKDGAALDALIASTTSTHH